MPDVKNGNILAADYVLSQLGVKTNQNWTGSYATGNPIWGTTDRRPQQVALTTMAVNNHTVPDVRGMGARDAVYLLEQSGLKVQIKGCGKVVKQSAVPGTVPHKGSLCEIILEN